MTNILARLRLVLAISVLLGAVSFVSLPLQAQEDPAEPPIVATQEPGLLLTNEPIPVVTETPLPFPTAEPSLVLTDELASPATAEPAPIITDEPASSSTHEPTPTIPWVLALNSTFDTGIPPELGSGGGWLTVDVDGGKALQSDTVVTPLALAQPLLNSAVEAKAWMNTGELVLTVREQGTDFYRATINTSGTVSLNRGSVLMANSIYPLTAGSWQIWRLEASETTVTVSVNGVEVLSAQDIAPLAAGFVSVSTASNSVLRIDELAIYADVPVVITPPISITNDVISAPSETAPMMQAPLSESPLPMGPITCPLAGEIAMASVNGTTQANGTNWFNIGLYQSTEFVSPLVSDNGQFVTFISYSGNLVAGDTNQDLDVFRFDRTNCSTVRISLQNNGTQFAQSTTHFSASDDGNLISFDNAGKIYVRNVSAGTTTYIKDGKFGMISGNGQYLAYVTTLAPTGPDVNGVEDIYRTNVSNGSETLLVSVSETEVAAPASAKISPTNVLAISDDGNYIAWVSTGLYGFSLNNNGCDTDGNSTFTEKCYDIFWRDISGGHTQVISVTDAGVPGALGAEDGFAGTPSSGGHIAISGDGRYVAFVSASSLDGLDTDNQTDVYIRDTQTANTTLVSVDHLGQNTASPAAVRLQGLSDDGDRVVIEGIGLTAVNAPGTQIYVRSVSAAQNVLASVNSSSQAGTGENGFVTGGSITGDGAQIAFSSTYSSLVPNDTVANCEVDNMTVFVPAQWDNNENCNDAFIAPVPAFPITGPLTTPTVSASITQTGQITLSLGGLGSGNEYRIERHNGTAFVQIGTTTTNSFVDNNSGSLFACSTSKQYRVRSYRSADTSLSSYSSTVVGSTAPCGPTITTPTNNSATNQTTPTVTWSAVAGATAYTLEKATNAAFTIGFQQFTGLMTTSHQLSAPYEGNYYVRVRATAPVVSDYSAVVMFTIDLFGPFAPSITNFPSDVTDMTPTFSWQPVLDAVKYHLDLSTDGFTTYLPGYEHLEVLGTNHTPTTPFPNQSVNIWWRVRGVDAAGNLGYHSSSILFDPQLELTPANNSTVTSNRPTFTWSSIEVPGATYTLEIHEGSAYNAVAFSKSGLTTTTYTMSAADPVLPNRNLFWRVRASSETSGTDWGNSFTVNALTPAPTLNLPLDNSTFNTAPQLTWTVPSYAYALGQSVFSRVQVDDNSDFSSLIVNHTLTPALYTPTNLPDGIYYWRVAIVNTTQGPYSAVRTFSIDTGGDDTPVGSLNPANGTRLSTPRPVFTWEPVTGAAGLVLQIDDDGNFSSGLLHTSAVLPVKSVTYTPPISAPLPQGIHFWRVVRLDALGNLGNPIGTGSQFSLFLGTTPAIGAQVTTGRPTFTWIAAGTTPAPTYTLQIDNNSDFSSLSIPAMTTNATTLNMALFNPMPDALTDGTYFWRVLLNGEISIDNLALSFLVSTTPLPGVPVFTAPPASANTVTPVIAWNAATNAVSYFVEVGTSSTFVTVPLTTFVVSDTNVDAADWATNVVTALPIDGIYFIRVRGQNSVGAFGSFSATRQFVADTSPPPAVTGLQPNSSLVPVTTVRPTFSWNKVTGATRYLLQIDDDGVFDTGLNNEGDIYNVSVAAPLGAVVSNTMSPEAVALNQNLVYKWRVMSVDALGNASLATEAEVVVLLGNTPVNGTIVTNGLPSFAWTAVAGAPGINIEIDNDLDFSSPTLINAAVLPSAAVKATATVPVAPGYYVWRVLPVGGDYGTLLTPRSLLVTPNVLPIITAPAAKAVLADNTPLITWTDSNAPLIGTESVRQYRVEVRSGTVAGPIAFSDNTTRTGEADALSLEVTPLLADGVYVARVAIIFDPTTPELSDVPGAFSAPITFTVDATDPGTPELVAPVSEATAFIRPVFTWKASAGAAKYRLEIDPDGDFDTGALSFLVNAPTVSFTIPATTYLRQGIWFWRVTAIDAAGNESVAGETRQIHTNASLTPLNGVFSTLVRPTFTWAAVTGATGYTLQVSTDSSFGSFAYTSTLGAVTTHTIPLASPALAVNTQFFWRVLPIGGNTGTDAIDTSYSFLTISAPATPAISTSLLINALKPLTTWATSLGITATPVMKDVANATEQYVFQIAPNVGFTGIVVEQTVANPTLLAATYTLTPGKYFVRVKSCYSNGTTSLCSPFSVARSFTIVTPPAISLTSPKSSLPGQESIQGNRPTFTWVAVPNAVRYQIEVAGDSAFTNMFYISLNTLTGTSHTMPVTALPLPQGQVHARLIVFDATGTSISSLPNASFIISVSSTPLQNAIVATQRPTFTWLPTLGATSYTLQVDTDEEFTSIDYTFTGNITTHTMPANGPALNDNTAYFWRVFPNTQPNFNVFGVKRGLFVRTALLLPPTLVSPVNAGVTQAPVLDWSDVSNEPGMDMVDGYEIQIATNNAFTAGVRRIIVGTSSVDPSMYVSLPDGIYFWRVRAAYFLSSFHDPMPTGPYSAVRSFTKDTTPPAVPVITLPAANAVLSNLRPTITWTAIVGATSYRVDIASDSTFSTLLVNNAIVNAATFTPVTPLPQSTLYVRVRSVDALGNVSASSITRLFSIFIGKTPLSAAITIDTTPEFTWATQTGISTYTLQVDLDGDFSSVDYTYSVSGISFTPTIPLATGAYLWRVIDAADSSTSGITRLLLISPTAALPAPSAVTPTGMINEAAPPIAWIGVSLPGTTVEYELQVASLATFAPVSLIINKTDLVTSPFIPQASLSQAAKFVRVRAKYTVSATDQVFFTAYTAPVSFTIDTVAPVQPVLTAPVQNAMITITRTPTFTWGASSGATSYRIEIDNNSDLNSPFYSSTAATLTRPLPGSAGLANGVYFWQVIASDAAGNETVSVIRTFTVAVP